MSVYICQTNQDRLAYEEKISNLASYLEHMMENKGTEFVQYQTFFCENYAQIRIPFDYDGNYMPMKQAYEKAFAERYPGSASAGNIALGEMEHSVQLAFAKYYYAYWLSVFERAKEVFDVSYVYYMIPDSNTDEVFYVVDGVRMEQVVDGGRYIELGHGGDLPKREYPKMWEAWSTGKKPEGYDVFRNEFGRTYAYYVPLVINGTTMGIIGADVEIADVDAAILKNTVHLAVGIGIVVLLGSAVLLWLLSRFCVRKIVMLSDEVCNFSENKDAGTAKRLFACFRGQDEIAQLGKQTGYMILELCSYMEELLATNRELEKTKKIAEQMRLLANHDALTGLRNRVAYDKEKQRLDQTILQYEACFGIGVVDLKYLKRINDTFGHEKGNEAIKRISHLICVTFAHSPIFRIGGDEFTVILEHEDYKKRKSLLALFQKELEKLQANDALEPWERVSASIGIAVFERKTDKNVDDVFRRADRLMYQNKKELKA